MLTTLLKHPATLDEALSFIQYNFGIDGTEAIRKGDVKPGDYHHGFGTFLRNELLLWHPESADLRAAIWNAMTDDDRAVYNDHWARCGQSYQGPNMHADDASHELLKMAFKKIKEETDGK